MFDIKWIRDNAEAFDLALSRRGVSSKASGILDLDSKRRNLETKAQKIKAERNQLSKEIGAAKSKGEDITNMLELVSKTKSDEAKAEKEALSATKKLEMALSELPNIPDEDVPNGPDETANRLIRVWGEKPEFNFEPKEHFAIGESLGMMDFETAAKVSRSRFVFLSNALARLERAISNFMLDLHTLEHGLTEVNPPALVNNGSMFGTGQLPKFGDDLFKTEDGLWLIPTAEVPLTNIVANTISDIDSLPQRLTAMTWCFRSEAGAAGKDTRGMIRQHQFTKVEMVTITDSMSSEAELERMTNCAEEVLKRLNIAFRTVLLSTGDMGFSAKKTYDIEVWLPGQDKYREISSCSNCGDFQARRMKARYRGKGEKETSFVHTLNGSGLAVGRTLIAILENYQQADGSVIMPEALRPYMGGLEVISANVD
ncbi:MAG: serine--tRNA ligase [Pseudomonadota bacterium]|nr:serine--tRNA ligase [Pseudomonadota bacterium]